LYLDEGGHSEIVGAGGFGFKNRDVKSFLYGLEETYQDYNKLVDSIDVHTIEKATTKYEEVFRVAIQRARNSKR